MRFLFSTVRRSGALVAAAGAAWLAAAAVHAAPAAAGDDFLDPDAAFHATVVPAGERAVSLRIDIAPGYHLYRDRTSLEATPTEALRSAPALPAGRPERDETLGETVAVWRDHVAMDIPVAGAAPVILSVRYQGCADRGLCYPPMMHQYRLRPGAAAWEVAGVDDAPAAPPGATATARATAQATPAASADTSSDDTGQFAGALRSGSLWRVAGVFLLAGLLLSFTPCVLPMVPILSSIIVGQSGTVSRARGFSLAAAYALGMALVYTAVGVAAGLLGQGLASALQNPWVLSAFALLLVAFSLSMFGVYSLQVPAGLQGRLSEMSGRLQGGRHAGVFLMGGLSALIVGPCVAAPLAGALVYISQTRDAMLGGVALFALASGMSVPLLLVGLSAGSLLPRAGAWMERVKQGFGVMLLAVAWWMVWPVLPAAVSMLLAAAGLMGLAAWVGLFGSGPAASGARSLAGRTAGTLLAAMALMELVGVASGGREPFQPLRHIASASAASSATGSAPAASEGPRFTRVASLQALEQAVRESSRPVMVDVYADWCVSCRELDARTFGDEAVRRRLSELTLLRVDVTAGSAEDQALMKRFNLFGPPALLFFPGRGAVQESRRVIGFQEPERFLRTLSQL